MSPDMNAMIQQIQEAERAMALAITQIHEQQARIAALEEENERLRTRLVKAMAVIEHYESPDK